MREDFSDHVHSMGRQPADGGRKPRVFAFAPNLWDGPWMNRQHILSRLAQRGWPVTYSTGPLSIWQRGSHEWKMAPWFSTYETCDGVQIDLPGRSLLRWPSMASYDRFVTRRHAAKLRSRCSAQDALAYVFHPGLRDIAAAMNCRWTVYHAYDIYAQQPDWSDELAAAQDALLREADLVIASSPTVAEALHGRGRDDVLVLPNGGDAAAFEAGSDLPCPEDLARIPHPRIGYIGSVNRKVDFPMIAAVATRRQDWHWIFVGPLATKGGGAPANDAKIAAAFAQCQALPNVHFLGNKPHTVLPAYAAHMDVNTMCYRSDPGWWTAAAPLKLHEYLAAGRPVVSVDLRDIRAFADVVSFVAAPDGWMGALEAALADRSAQSVERRRRTARANSWDSRVDLLEENLVRVTSGAGARAQAFGRLAT